jgi:hypothetical protein
MGQHSVLTVAAKPAMATMTTMAAVSTAVSLLNPAVFKAAQAKQAGSGVSSVGSGVKGPAPSLPNGLLLPVTPPQTPEGEVTAEGLAIVSLHQFYFLGVSV